ncbi:MAG: diguanylate cyclase [Dehalococcoidia bacterium]
MRRYSTSFSLALVMAFAWTIVAAAAIGTAMGGHRAALAWAILGFVAIASVARPFRTAGIVAAIIGIAVFVVAVAAQLHLDTLAINTDNLDVRALVVAGVAFIVTPFILRLMLDEIERVQRQVLYQSSVIEDLTVRDTSTGAFKPKYIETILSEEIDRARRYHRSLTLAIVAADDWNSVVDDLGEVGARGLASRVVDQLAKGTRTVDKIVQLGDGAFSIVLPETPLEGAEVLADRLQSAASAEAGIPLRIGLADFPRDAVTSEALLREAQEALTFARTADLLVVDRTLLGMGA